MQTLKTDVDIRHASHNSSLGFRPLQCVKVLCALCLMKVADSLWRVRKSLSFFADDYSAKFKMALSPGGGIDGAGAALLAFAPSVDMPWGEPGFMRLCCNKVPRL